MAKKKASQRSQSAMVAKFQPDNEGWRRSFKSSSLKLGFSLSLSRPMLEYLCMLSTNMLWDTSIFGTSSLPDRFVGAEKALLKRGFIERAPQGRDMGCGNTFEDELRVRFADDEDCWCRLTPVGEKVVELLHMTGAFLAKSELQKLA
jgi:hypothetical protein